VLREDSGGDEAENLRREDDGHEGGTYAAHEFGRGGLLEERLGWDDDSGYGEADDEIADDRGPEVWEHRKDAEADGHAEEAGVDEQGVRELLAKGVEAVDAEQHAETDHRGADAEELGGGVE